MSAKYPIISVTGSSERLVSRPHPMPPVPNPSKTLKKILVETLHLTRPRAKDRKPWAEFERWLTNERKQ